MPVIITGDASVGELVTFGLIADAGSAIFAKPKSSTFTVPSDRT